MDTYRHTDPADAELEMLYQALMGRRDFSYHAAEDPMYRSYADRYVQNGRLAMRDAMGSAAALTGGYGSSYAQAVGQQTFDEYLRQLSEAMPELYGMAYQRYLDEGESLRDRYDLAYQRREGEREQERAEAAAAYQRERDALADERYRLEQESRQAQQSYKQRQDSYQNLVKLVSTSGYSPTDAELSAAGLSRASAEALRKEYERAKGIGQSAQSAVYTRSASTPRTSSGSSAATVHKTVSGAKTSKGSGNSSAASAGFKGGLPKR